MPFLLLIFTFVSFSSVSIAQDSPPPKTETEQRLHDFLDHLDRWSFRGNIKVAFRFAKNRERIQDNQFGFELSTINLRFRYKVKKKVQIRVHYQIEPNDIDLQEAHIRFKKTAGFRRIHLGLQERVFNLESDLETNTLNHIAFYQMEDLGALGELRFFKHWQLFIGLFNGGRLNERDISPRRVSRQDVILSDRLDRRQAIGTSSRELVFAAGYEDDPKGKKLKIFQVRLFATVAPLSDEDTEDLDTFADVPGFTGVNEGNTSYVKTGFNVVWRYGKWRTYNQFMQTRIRDLERTLFTTEWSYRFKKWQPIIAMSQQSLSVDPTPLSPLSWRRIRVTLGVRQDVGKRSRVAYEVTSNEEDTGGRFINNDEMIITWVYGF